MSQRIEVIVEGTRYPSISQACRAYDMSITTVHNRIRKGWSIEESIVTPKLRGPRIISLEGHLYMSLKEVANEFDISYETLHQRLQRGMSLLDAITTPVEEARTHNGKITFIDGVSYGSIKEAAEAHGIDPYVVRLRLHKGWCKDRAFKTPSKSRRSK